MGYRYDADDVDYEYYADQYFSRVYDSPEERVARLNPTPKVVESSDDGYDAYRDEQMNTYNPKDYSWGSWDK
jgi:hypothetical protein